jgi:NAD(P)-dependent dehydrogenase (short-subunit alcohol dehydrogenase family)
MGVFHQQEAVQKGASVILVARTASKLKGGSSMVIHLSTCSISMVKDLLPASAEAAAELQPLANKRDGQKVLWAAVDVGAGYKDVEAALSAAIKSAGAPVDVCRCACTIMLPS